MSKELKKYTVSILDEPFSLVTDEPEEHVRQAAAFADKMLQEIKHSAPTADSRKIAILGILQLASKYLIAQDKASVQNNMHQKLIQLIDQELSVE
jgi:cell division protein ZapA